MIECNCAATAPTMPTCRDRHLSSCPASVLDFLGDQERQNAEMAASYPRAEPGSKDPNAALRGVCAGYGLALRIVRGWLLQGDAKTGERS